MNAAEPLPLQWEINGLKLAGLSWGKPGDRPLLALHGWLDNAASFSLLAPLMTGYHVVALDLTGHGRLSVTGLGPAWDGPATRCPSAPATATC